MQWNVYYHDFNRRKITTFNVFDHGRFCADLAKLARQRKKGDDGKTHYISKEEFTKGMKSLLMYYYWSKCEWEIVIGPWVGDYEKEAVKIDVYDQLKLNFDIFVDYVWGHISEVRKLDKQGE